MEIYWKNICFAYRSTQSHKKRPETKTELLTTYNEGFTIPEKRDIIDLQMFAEFGKTQKGLPIWFFLHQSTVLSKQSKARVNC